MKTYSTNAALGYNQYAILLQLDETENGHNYLVIDRCVRNEEEYIIGSVVKDLEFVYVDETHYKLTDSPLHGTFLFDYFVNNHKEL